MGKKGRLCVLCTESRTPALSAAMVGHTDCLQEAYKSLNVLNERDRFGATPMHYAARHGQLECLQWLIENSNVSPNAAARNGSTPAHDAAATGNVECLRYLLENTKCSPQELTIEGATVLHMACRFSRVHATRWLIDKAGASPSDKGANDVTPVHLCAAKNNIACLRWLTKHPGYEPNQVTAHGATPVYFAAQEGSLQCLDWLVTEGNGDVFACAKDGMYALHASAQAGQFECLQYLINDREMSVRLRSSDGATAAHFAAAGGHVECLRWLLDMDEELATVRDNLGGTPMHDAAEEGQASSLEEFIRRGVDVEVKDYDGITPLHLAEEHNHEDCIALLRAYKEEKKAKSTKVPKVFIPIKKEEEEDLKQKELEEQQRRRLAAALIQEEEQKLEEWRKKQEQTLSLGEQLEKLKEMSQSEDESRGELGHFSRHVLVAHQGTKQIKQTRVTVQEAVMESEASRRSQIIEATSQLAVQAADTAELSCDSRSTSPVPNGHAPSELPSRETSPSVPVHSADVFSDTEDQYRRGMSGRRKKSLLDLFRIKKKKKKKPDENEKNKKSSIQSGFLSDSDTENTFSTEAKNRTHRRWWLFRSPKPATSTVLEECPEPVIEECPEPVIEECTEPDKKEIVGSRVEVPTQNGDQSKCQVPTADGGERILAKPRGSAEIRRRKTMEASAREQMKEASKLVVALRKANQEKRKQSREEDNNAQQKEDEEDRERHRKMSVDLDQPPLPPVTEQKKRRAFEDAIFTTWKGSVEPYPSTRLVQESLKDEMKIQQRNSTEIVLREEGEMADEERDDASKWAKASLSPTDEESDEEENTDWHPELTSTLPKKRRNLCSALSAAGQWKHDESQMPRCDEDPAGYIQVTEAREHIYEEPSLIAMDKESDAGEIADPLYADPNDESIETVKRELPETGSQPPTAVPIDHEVADNAKFLSHDISIVSSHTPQNMLGSKVENRNCSPEDSNSDSKAESEGFQVRAKQMAKRHSVDLDQSLHEVTMQREFEQRLVVAEEAQRQLKEQQRRRSGAFVADSEEKTQLEEKAKVLSEVKVEREKERQQRDEFRRRLEEAAKKRVEKEEKTEKEKSLEKGMRSSPDIAKLVARRKEEGKQIERKLSHSPNGIDPNKMLHKDIDAWDQLRKEEEYRMKNQRSKDQMKIAALRRISRSISPGAISRESTISKEQRAMESAFLALNDSFADMGLRGSMIPEQMSDEEPEGPLETAESELDLDLLLADLDKAITLATERVVSGTVGQEIAYASGTRNRRKFLTPQHTPQKNLTPQMTPRDTPGSSKGGTPSASDMRNQLRRLVLDGQRQEESLKRKKSSNKKKAEKTDSKPKEEARFTVHDDEGHEFSVPVKKTMTAQMLVHKVTEQYGRQLLPTLSIVESFQDLHIERRLEDHELVDDVVRSWQGHKAAKLIIRDTPTKYDLWEKPQLVRHVLIQFCDYGVVPEISGPLYERDNRKKVWRERMFVLEEDSIMGAATYGSTDKRHMVVVASLRNHNIYTPFGDQKANRGPTPFCIFLKPHKSVARKEMVALCAPNIDTMTQWIAASRLVKFGPRLKEDYSTMRQQFAAFVKTQESSSLHY